MLRQGQLAAILKAQTTNAEGSEPEGLLLFRAEAGDEGIQLEARPAHISDSVGGDVAGSGVLQADEQVKRSFAQFAKAPQRTPNNVEFRLRVIASQPICEQAIGEEIAPLL